MPDPMPCRHTAGAARVGWLICLVAPVLLLSACGDGPERIGARINVLIITLDTTRADHLGAYGYPLDITPVLDGLAGQGVLFENAYAPMPQTLPSHATIMSGLPPRQHGALENSYSVHEGVETMAELLSAEGYATAAFVGALVLGEDTGIQQGFATYDQPPNIRGPSSSEREATEVTDKALEWAATHDSSKPFLMWAHYFDAHGDHVAPRRYRRQIPMEQLRSKVLEPRGNDARIPGVIGYWYGYAAEVRYVDAQIGRLIDGLRSAGLLDNTLVVIVGDHGEGLYEHGVKGHGVSIWQEQLHIPFVMLHPEGKHQGVRVSQPVGLVDVLPTVLHSTLGIEGDPRATDKGLDLWAALDAGHSLPDRPVFMERPHYRKQHFVQGGSWLGEGYGVMAAVLVGHEKLLLMPDGRQELYDLALDPHELTDLAAEEPARVKRLAGLLDHWLSANDVGAPGQNIELSAERLEVLKSLGYIGGDG